MVQLVEYGFTSFVDDAALESVVRPLCEDDGEWVYLSIRNRVK